MNEPQELRPLLRGDGAVVVPRAIAGPLLRLIVSALLVRVRTDGGLVAVAVTDVLLELQRAQELEEAGVGSVDGTPGPEVVMVDDMTTMQVAAVLGCTERYARRLVSDGSLKARRVGRCWLIDAASLARFRTRRGDAA